MAPSKVCKSSAAFLAALCLVKVVTSENCSTDGRTSIDWSMASAGGVSQLEPGTGSTLFLANSSLQCNGSVDVWRLCLTVNHSNQTVRGGGATPTFGSVSFGVWRRSGNNSNSFGPVKELEVVRPAMEFLSLDFFCMRHNAMQQVDVMFGDVVGVVTDAEEPSVFSILSSSSDNRSENCTGTRNGGESIDCSSMRYNFYLEPFQGDGVEFPTNPQTPPSMVGTSVESPGGEPVAGAFPWPYLVMGVLVLLLLVAVLAVVVLSLQLFKRSRLQKNFSLMTPKFSSPRYVPSTAISVLENKNLRVGGDSDAAESSSGRESRNSTGGCGQLEVIHNEAMAMPPDPLNSVFSYPPPASRAPLPPMEAENEVSRNGIQELSVKGLTEDDTEKQHSRTGSSVPHYPLKVSNSEPVALSVKLEEKEKESGDCTPCDNEVFEDMPPRKCSTPPVPAPRKGVSLRKGNSFQNKAGPANGGVLSSLASAATAKEGSFLKEDSSKDSVETQQGSEYENIKHNIERMKSAPATSDPSPVYAEPMVSNQRARIMTYNPGVSKTPPLSGSRKLTGTPRQRSISGGDTSSLALQAHILKTTRSAEGGSQGLDKIKEESFHEAKAPVIPALPEDYLEPVVNKSKNKNKNRNKT